MAGYFQDKLIQFNIIIIKASLFTEHADVVSVLVSSDNTILDCQDRYGNTTLRSACEEESQEGYKLLIGHGASRIGLC